MEADKPSAKSVRLTRHRHRVAASSCLFVPTIDLFSEKVFTWRAYVYMIFILMFLLI